MRIATRWTVLGATLFVSTQLLSHAQSPAPDPPRFKVGVDIVRIDAVVTDRDGNIVTDLTADDFEIRQDGEVQPITLAQYVAIENRRTPAAPAAKAAPGAPAPLRVPVANPTRPTTASVRRTIVLVVDDIGIAWENLEATRKALRRFIDEDVQEGDLVALVRTGAAWGALQQLTTDKRVLHSAIDQVRWTALSRREVTSCKPLNQWQTFETRGSTFV